MSAEEIARAVEPFYTTKPEGRGTGLGLSMVYGFARQSGGYLQLSSRPGVGTTACIYIPRHEDAAGRTAILETLRPGGEAQAAEPSKSAA
jgi:signal transduction histidine kinase